MENNFLYYRNNIYFVYKWNDILRDKNFDLTKNFLCSCTSTEIIFFPRWDETKGSFIMLNWEIRVPDIIDSLIHPLCQIER